MMAGMFLTQTISDRVLLESSIAEYKYKCSHRRTRHRVILGSHIEETRSGALLRNFPLDLTDQLFSPPSFSSFFLSLSFSPNLCFSAPSSLSFFHLYLLTCYYLLSFISFHSLLLLLPPVAPVLFPS
ncbi:uncharacterized protein EURHEDRAFT_241544 [Aspergillus ruber CBS 135680]|uniref:Uncharacterized protein n=1 Tax=Aspergillus ruber (strain CBS 135680) TaxID=1388766 RepID=A0A017S4F6_ASPRC|nr:uncharacterized protein EURHEDRAFT_241544 [Aspergillus ruber CBS 135680]EYE91499.1 hypothetical protein EURHEDRAFT_241544 [Aspergillus ruber CBS 135680]